jgi:hypothetical protein
MSSLTVGRVAMNAADVLCESHLLQVGRIDAQGVATEVVEGQPFMEWPAAQVPSHAVRVPRHGAPTWQLRNVYLPIGPDGGAGPHPALARLVDATPEAVPVCDSEFYWWQHEREVMISDGSERRDECPLDLGC